MPTLTYVTPWDAAVHVDGYYAGMVNVRPYQTVRYRADMRRIVP